MVDTVPVVESAEVVPVDGSVEVDVADVFEAVVDVPVDDGGNVGHGI